MGCLLSKREMIYDYKPFLDTKEAEINILNNQLEHLRLQLQYFMTNKDDIHDKYYDLLTYNKKIESENNMLKKLLRKNGISYNTTD